MIINLSINLDTLASNLDSDDIIVNSVNILNNSMEIEVSIKEEESINVGVNS